MSAPRVVSVVTGTRAEYGLLRSVMTAIDAHPDLELEVLVTGTHLLPPRTIDEVRAAFAIAATIPMQEPGVTGRDADAAALGRGVALSAPRRRHKPKTLKKAGESRRPPPSRGPAPRCAERPARVPPATRRRPALGTQRMSAS